MPFEMIAVYFTALGIAAGILAYAHRLCSRYLLDFVTIYFIYLLFSVPLSVLGKPLPVLIVGMMKLKDLQADQFMLIFNLLLAKPIWILSIYFLAKCIAALVEKKLSRAFNSIFLLFWVGFIFSKLLFTIQFFKFGTQSYGFQIFNRVGNILDVSAALLIFGFGILQARKIKSRDQKKGALIFSAIGFLSYSIFWMLIFLYFSFTIPFLFGVAIPIPALLYLAGFLKRTFPAGTVLPDSTNDIETGLTRFNITPREREIITHICSGRSNKEIASALFISIHTVKRHINQIYHKLGIKNRVQLANWVRENTNQERIADEPGLFAN